MKLDIGGYAKTVRESADTLAAAEAAGYDGSWVAETQIDALTALAVAAGDTSRIQLGTGIVVAFARNPMTVAITANDVRLVSGGRLLLGVGSQVRPHITKRFSIIPGHRKGQVESRASRCLVLTTCSGRTRRPGCGSSSLPCGRSGRAGPPELRCGSAASSTRTR